MPTCRSWVFRTGVLAVPAVLFAMLSAAKADELTTACQAPGWDMNRELAAFRGAALSAKAGGNPADSPEIKLGRLYALQLRPQNTVQFLRPPEKTTRLPSPAAGLARFSVGTDGHYRVTVDGPLWIDVVAPTGTVQSSSFNGWHECHLYRKSVDYTLHAGQPLMLQLSGAASALVKLAIEPL